MKASSQAVRLIKQFEGMSLDSYECEAGKWTIGYGQTGPTIGPGLKITPHEAEELLKNHIARLQEEMTPLIKVKITQSQFDALVSFVYNVGITAFRHSTLLKKLNAGDSMEAANELHKWIYVAGEENDGLKRRRREEYYLFKA